MAAIESPIAKSSRSSSLDSVKNWEHRSCHCGIRARIYTSWSLNNPGRHFFKCSKPKAAGGCDFSEWYVADFTGRAKYVITDLNHRRIFLEEMMRLVEKNLEKQIDEKKALKDENKKILERTLAVEDEMKIFSKKLKICMFVVVVLLGLLFCETG